MRVGEDEADSTLANALSMAPLFSLKKAAAIQQVREVVAVVNDWQKHYAECGVTRGDIDLYVEQIDRPFLLEQRQEFTAWFFRFRSWRSGARGGGWDLA